MRGNWTTQTPILTIHALRIANLTTVPPMGLTICFGQGWQILNPDFTPTFLQLVDNTVLLRAIPFRSASCPDQSVNWSHGILRKLIDAHTTRFMV